MSIKNSLKVNDLAISPLRERFLTKQFIPTTNLAVCFGRVSTKGQKDQGNSDVAQLESMEKYAQEKDLKIMKSWDVAETASKPNKRVKFHEMINFVKANSQIKHVIFSHQSRSNRNRESARELETLLKLGVVLHFSRDHRTISSQSEIDELLMWDVNNILNEKFIRDHTKNVMDGTIKRLEAGLFPCKAPFGYKNVRRDDQLSVFVFDPINSLYVKAAFELFSTGNYTLASLKKELDDKFPYVTKKPDVKRFGVILRTHFYYGKFMYDGVLYDGHPEFHPPLVTYGLWKKVQDIFKSEDRMKYKVTEKAHPYVGLIKCDGKILDEHGNETEVPCGCSVTAEEKRKKLANGTIKHFYYYHCSNTTRDCSQRNKGFMSEQSYKKLSYSESEIEELFLDVFMPLNFTDEVVKWMQGILLEQHREASQCHRQHLGALQGRLKMLDNYIDKAYEDKLAGSISEEMWREKNQKWQLERESVKGQIDRIDNEKDDYIEKGVLLIELAQRTESIYKNGSSDVKRKLVQIVSSNHRLRNGSICFDYKKPFDILAKNTDTNKWWM